MLNSEHCWEAVQKRDGQQDGRFFFGVVTTGVYCRVSCPARRPLGKNVRFYETAADAERDGLRACLRCRPLAIQGADPNTERVRELCRYIESHSDEALPLRDLARRAGLSPFYLQRSFKAVVGLSPKQYQEAARLKRFKKGLKNSKDVTQAVYDAGFGSSNRAYEPAATRLGMTPNQYPQRGPNTTITHPPIKPPIGLLMMAATDRGVCFVRFGESEAALLAELASEDP